MNFVTSSMSHQMIIRIFIEHICDSATHKNKIFNYHRLFQMITLVPFRKSTSKISPKKKRIIDLLTFWFSCFLCAFGVFFLCFVCFFFCIFYVFWKKKKLSRKSLSFVEKKEVICELLKYWNVPAISILHRKYNNINCKIPGTS